ncbi:D-methionine transport system ATP-binding protein [Ruminiclostridium sufflavum DSM 19573]|uniref:D-methionine transport system ATP-binding protein n=1 Tax=Ruminiclostridium sufflavum DSM 19573 TaxID=1121337 RepID=A0A318XQI7_9FIRM|nr:ATP-binding cassette domain-containing protein [Ruminiclostridium sufflavum]PYG89455.1 D-methionine transport system ATP-binding protein [Ruminiclostridium sufflavum DSM 19573]
MIRFENVSVSFPQKNGQLHAVNNVSLSIGKGQIYGLIGASGAGKSTLLRTVNLLERPTAGRVYVNGELINGLRGKALRQYRRNIGIIFQHFNLAANKTVRQNIEFPLKAANMPKPQIKQRVDELLKLVGLSDKHDAYPAKLSGGQKQRVGIARALANNASILLCDEATSALDPETTVSILKLLEDINKRYGITIIIITHEIDVVKAICTKMAVMNSGSVVEYGDVIDIISKPNNNFTKKLISYAENFELPAEIINIFGKESIVKITYLGSEATEPILSNAIKENNVDISILHGKIDYIDYTPVGTLIVSVKGEDSDVRNAIEYIKSKTLRTEVGASEF